MDCTIPSHYVRTFSASIATLGKIGKDLYVDFDPLDGLTLRTLNDAKSAFASFHFEPGFFERCSAPPRIASSGNAAVGEHGTRDKIRKRRRESGADRRQQEGHADDAEGYLCRVPIRAVHSILRPRRGVRSVRIRSHASNSSVSPDGEDQGMLMQLSFEFRIDNSKSGGNMRAVHRVGVSDADGVTAVAPREGCSEIGAAPRVLLRMLDPLRRTSEVALIVSDALKVVTATSFHHGDTTAVDNALVHAVAPAVLKTETSIGCDEFDEFSFRDDREIDDGDANVAGDVPPPVGVNDEVTLVFGIKEAKAMLQFCAQAHLDEEMRVVISFHWGGKPIILETEGDNFSAQVIMATLDHKLLGGVSTSRSQRGGSANGVTNVSRIRSGGRQDSSAGRD